MPTAKTTTKRPSGARTKSDNVFTDEERAAVQATARERKSQGRRLSPEEERKAGEKELRDKVAEMPSPDREMGERIHALVTKTAPGLVPKTYYGMPAWAKDGKVICFFKPASKFKVRYASFEFQPDASLDDGEMWPVSFAVIKLTAGVEARIADLVKKAAG
jgi:uncharacterized protein YdhG (YjbR/CyaY superfamily)